MPVEYPATLPPPSSYGFGARERRALSQGDGHQQARVRGRDAIVDAPGVTWRYSPAEMEIWQQWYRTELLWGQRWFAVPLPGFGGELVRVARYVSPVGRQHLAGGVFGVSADLELRGRSQLPALSGGAVPVIGWHVSNGSWPGASSSGISHANSGTGNTFGNPNPWPSFSQQFFCGVVGYTSGTVVWSSTWAPLSGGAAPNFDDSTPGTLAISNLRAGLLTITATVNGVSVGPGQGLVVARTTAGYSNIAWGPEP